MLPYIEHFPQNWIDGMKISKQHFVDNDKAFTDQIRDSLAVHLTNYNYGLLMSAPNDVSNLEISLHPEYVELSSCRAITQGGSRIEIRQGSKLTPPLTKKLFNLEVGAIYNIIIRVNISDPQAAGIPDPKESSLRLPYAIPNYDLDVVQLENGAAENFLNELVVGRFKVKESGFESIDYIPACTRITTQWRMKAQFHEIISKLESILSDGKAIIRKANKITNQPKTSEDKVLRSSVASITEKIVFFLAENLDFIKNVGDHLPPIHLFTFVQRLGRVLETAIECRQQPEDHILRFYAWVLDKNIGQLNRIFSLLHHQEETTYKHTEIWDNSLLPTQNFLDEVSLLFNKIAHVVDISWKQVEKSRPKPPPSFTHEESNNSSNDSPGGGIIIR